MDYFRKLPGFRRSPAGLEWLILRKLPLIIALGILVPAAVVFFLWYMEFYDKAQIDKIIILTIAWTVLYCTIMITLGIGAFIVMVMKGPAYVADAYYPPDFHEPDDLKSAFWFGNRT